MQLRGTPDTSTRQIPEKRKSDVAVPNIASSKSLRYRQLAQTLWQRALFVQKVRTAADERWTATPLLQAVIANAAVSHKGLFEVQQLLGHKELESTLVYTRVETGVVAVKAAEIMNRRRTAREP